jgi:trk system potassium uptake protein TrkA
MAKYAVIGLGRFGSTVATKLFENGDEVIAFDNNPKAIEEIKGRVSNAVILDSTDERALKEQGINEMDGVILAIGNNIEVSVLTVVILKKFGAGPIYAKVDNKLHRRIMEMLGIKNIYFPEEQIGEQLANSLLSKNVLNYFDLNQKLSVTEITVPPEYVSKTLQDLALPAKRKINIIAIKYQKCKVTDTGDNIIEWETNDMPGANDIIKEGDVLVLLGQKHEIVSLIREISGK